MSHRGGHRAEARAEARSRSPRTRPAPTRGGHKQLAREQDKPATNTTSDTAPELEKQDHLKIYQKAVFDLFLKNDMSAKRTHDLAQKAQAAGAKGAERISAAGGRGKHEQNLARDIMRTALRRSTAPPLYYASIPTRDRRSGKDQIPTLFPFLLVHEMMHMIATTGQALSVTISELPETVASTLRATATSLNISTDGLIPIGFHGDAAPNQAKKSILCFSWNLLGQVRSERMLFTAISQEHLCGCGCRGRHTIDAILSIFVWSINSTFAGAFPGVRHDGSPMSSAADKWRRSMAGTRIGFKSVLLQCRGDWAWYKEMFSFPSWSSHRLCWRCEASRDGDSCFKNFGLKAAWRKGRLGAASFFDLQRDQGITPSPLFQAVGLKLHMVCIDVLHCMDLGVSQDILGNLFIECLGTICKGKNRKLQTAALWERIKKYYKAFDPPTQLQSITYEMIKAEKKAPKLRAKGAETRHLVPFGAILAKDLHAAVGSAHSQAIQNILLLLLDIYMHMSLRPYQSKEVGDSCRRLCILYSSLTTEAEANGDDHSWRIKPKMHMMVELLEFQTEQLEGSPTEFWAYMDEDFVGEIAQISSRRGGPAHSATVAEAVLNRYKSLRA